MTVFRSARASCLGSEATEGSVPFLRAERGSYAVFGVERRILAQDCLLELTQLARGIDPELVHERTPSVLIDLERLRLPTRAVEREHQLCTQPLAQRMLANERLQLANERGLAALGEVGFDSVLETGKAQVLETFDLVPSKALVGEVRQRRATPEGERLAGMPIFEEALKASQVELVFLDLQPIPGRTRDDARLAQHFP